MATVVSLLNFKGGVGKTTTTVNLGAALAGMKKKVLIIDLDGQRNATKILKYQPKPGETETIYDYLTNRVGEAFSYETPVKGLDIVPSSDEMADISVKLSSRKNREHILKKFVDETRSYYDFILLDCPPAKGVISDNAMTASDGLIIPIECEMLSLQGLEEIMLEAQEVKQELNPGLEIYGMLATKYDNRLCMNRELLDGLNQSFPGKVFQTRIRRNVSLAEFCDSSTSIYEYAPDSYGAADYKDLAKELIDKLKKS